MRVSLYEIDNRLGGHTNTALADTADGKVAVDTGFIVYNEENYPNLTALFAHLGVETAGSDMSFAVSADRGRLEYSGHDLNGLFGQRRNIVRPRHWQMVGDILRFFRDARLHLDALTDEIGIGTYLTRNGYSQVFIEDHILPISAAIWSTPARSMLDFPARTFVQFFANHGLLQVANRPQWRTVRGGAQAYVDRMLEDAAIETHTGARIERVVRHPRHVELVFADGRVESFDHVVFACPAEQALRLLDDVDGAEHALLSAFRTTPNRAVLHTDERLMPRRRHLWSSWNYIRSGAPSVASMSVTYWMNRLQPLPTRTNLFVSLNPDHDFAPGSVQKVIDYRHPLFDGRAIAAQRDMGQIQGVRRTWFAGAWLGYGFHEDGLQAGLEVAERIGPLGRPWQVERARDRIAAAWSGDAELQTAAQ